MLRTWLLVTTILTVASSASFSSGEAAEIPRDQPRGITMSAAGGADNHASALQTLAALGSTGRDRNTEFLCTYGYKVYNTRNCHSGSCYHAWEHYAVPIRGKGMAVTEIVVTNSPSMGSPSFTAGIYENAKGKPGALIVSGTGQARGSCLATKVAIAKTALTAGKRYWVVEDAPVATRNGTNAVRWGYSKRAKHNAYYQHFSSHSGLSGSLTDWLPVSGPAPRVKVQ